MQGPFSKLVITHKIILSNDANEFVFPASQDLNNSENSDTEYDFESHSDIEENQLEIEIEDNDSEDEESSEISPANQSETLTDARRYSPIPKSAGSVAVRYQQKLNHLYVSLKCKLQKQEKERDFLYISRTSNSSND